MSTETVIARTTAPASPRAPLAVRLALRELRGGLRGLYIVIACVALGVAAIAAVGSLSGALQRGFAAEGRAILGGDVAAQLIHRRANPDEQRFLGRYGQVSEVSSLRTMLRAGEGPAARQALVELKGVDRAYPLYGRVETKEAGALDSLIRTSPGGALADAVLLERLGVGVGDRLALGQTTITITGVLTAEPDRLSAGPTFGPRLLVSQSTIDASGLVRPGSLVTWSYRIRATEPLSGTDVSEALRVAFPEGAFGVRDAASPAPQVTTAIARFSQFLELAGLAALVIGGVGVANAVASFTERKRPVIATMKTLGASSSLIFQTYLCQVLLIASVGIAIGLALGSLAPLAAGAAFGDALPVKIAFEPHGPALLAAAGYGFLVALAFIIWPIGRARDVRPAQLYRDDVAMQRFWPAARYVLASGLVVAGLAAFMLALAERAWISAAFAAALALLLVVFASLGHGLNRLAQRLPRTRASSLALALASLAGPGQMVRSITLSLGVGLSLLSAIALIDRSLRNELQAGIPESAPSFFFLDITRADVEPFKALMAREASAASLEIAPMLRGRIVSLKGVPAETAPVSPRSAWVLNGDRGISYAETLPEGSSVVAGDWWGPGYDGPPAVSMVADLAEGLGLTIGDTITVNVLGRNITATLTNTRAVKWESLSINFVVLFSPNALAGAPFNYLATLTYPESQTAETEGRIASQVAQAFPAVTAIRISEALETVAGVYERLIAAISAAAGVTLIAGAIVLAGALATAQGRRIYEAVIFKTIGATRSRIMRAHLAEYAILALTTGLAALGLGAALAWAVVTFVMRLPFSFALDAGGLAIALALVLVAGFGLIGTWRTLSAKAAPILRRD